MKNFLIVLLKILVHLLALFPLVWILLRVAFSAGLLQPMAAVIQSHNYPIDLGADPIALITHVTGECTLYLLVLSLAITPLRRLPRLGWLIRFRRLLGLYAFFYGTLHLVTYFWLFSNFDFHAIGADLLKRRFIQVGMLAWLILLPLALTSTQWAIRKLGGRRWQQLHRLVYVAAIAGIIHFWWLVKPGNLSPLNITIFLAVLLLARLLWPVWRNLRSRRVKIQTDLA